MKILVTADVHFRSRWFHKLVDQAPNFDLICIAGDLLDMFSGELRIAQARDVSRWIRERN
jgi:Icc-related predicted phosphoesterase